MSRLTKPLRVVPALLLAACTSGNPPAETSDGGGGGPQTWTLSWHDEFDGAAGARPDTATWVPEVGGGGWGNQEREYYTAGENAALDGAGHLVITARQESANSPLTCWYGTCRYTSARIVTRGRMEWTYGKFEASIRVPKGQGLWPAFWLLGNDIGTAGWPTCGEIDVMENIGREPQAVHGTMHGPGYSGGNGIGAPYTQSAPFADDFHVFSVEWAPLDVRWYVDGKLYHEVTPSRLPAGARWVFDHPFFILLNVAVGGGWPGDPDGTTTFPQQMLVDYVRVYRR
jgi:beta-glucanase (GH16 family)